jgi:rubrerythrin
MNAYEIAMNMEQKAEEAYKKMAEEASDSTMKEALLALAKDEARHYKAFEKMAKKESALKDLEKFASDKNFAKDFFIDLKSQKKSYVYNDEQVEFYQKAAQLEDKAYTFYLEQAEEATDPDVKKAFTLIAKEEKKHHDFVKNLADFITSPEAWLESAEFYEVTKEL